MEDNKTPGVYLVENNVYPNSVVNVATAIPVFVGYTEKADRRGKGLTGVPTRITSMVEYGEFYGGAFHPKFDIAKRGNVNEQPEDFRLNGESYEFKLADKNELYLYRCLQFFYLNGGGDCYILSVGTYEDAKKGGVKKAALADPDKVFKQLEKEGEPTLLLVPDALALADNAEYYEVCQAALKHCGVTQSRFGIFDVLRSTDGTNESTIAAFRANIGLDFLNYGAAYYPWLKTSVIAASEVNFKNISDYTSKLDALIPEEEKNAKEVLTTTLKGNDAVPALVLEYCPDESATSDDMMKLKDAVLQNTANFHQSLMASSPTYKKIMTEIRSRLNILPPGAAMAGIYSLTDTNRGVWTAPANVSIAAALAPEVYISSNEQESMNIDPVSGKSINIIRSFPKVGTLVWGARTLDGNSQDWRYINVRRTMIMIEQSLKLAIHAFVFAPNDSGTWVSIQSMLNSFLTNLWKQGALSGSAPEQAFSVQIGLGITMTPNDILDGLLKITVKLAIVHPAEFIEITFQQQQQHD